MTIGPPHVCRILQLHQFQIFDVLRNGKHSYKVRQSHLQHSFCPRPQNNEIDRNSLWSHRYGCTRSLSNGNWKTQFEYDNSNGSSNANSNSTWIIQHGHSARPKMVPYDQRSRQLGKVYRDHLQFNIS